MIVHSRTRWRVVAFIVLAAAMRSGPAYAQARVYVSGDVFAEVMQLSRTKVTPPLDDSTADALAAPDGVTLGGGARVGAFLSPVWSLELGVDTGRALREERSLSIRSPIGLLIPPATLRYQSRTSQQYLATSILVGYHPVSRGRLRPGFRGGISFMRSERTFTVASASTLTFTPTVPGGGIVIPTVTLLTNDYTVVSYGLTATVAAETAIELSRRFAVVPEIRALAGGLGGIVLRPGAAAQIRW
jgi:hypothetical protein